MKKHDLFFKNSTVDLHRKFRRIFEASLVITLMFLIILFFSFKNFEEKPAIKQKLKIPIKTIDIPRTIHEKKIPPPVRPSIPVASEDEDFPEEITLPESEINFDEPLAQIIALPPEQDIEPPVPFYELSEKPIPVLTVNPNYPEIARKAGIQGMVVVKVLIGLDGSVEDVEVVKSHPMLDAAAIEAARQFKFKPGKQRDRVVRVWMSIPFNFRLKK